MASCEYLSLSCGRAVLRKTVCRRDSGTRAYREVFTACLPEDGPAAQIFESCCKVEYPPFQGDQLFLTQLGGNIGKEVISRFFRFLFGKLGPFLYAPDVIRVRDDLVRFLGLLLVLRHER